MNSSVKLWGGVVLMTLIPLNSNATAILTQFDVETVFSVYEIDEPGSEIADFERLSDLYLDLYDTNPLASGAGRALASPGNGFPERRRPLGEPVIAELHAERLDATELPYSVASTLTEPFGRGSIGYNFEDRESELALLSNAELHDARSGDDEVSVLDSSVSASVAGIDEVRYGAMLAWEILLSPDSFIVGSLSENVFVFDIARGNWAPILFGFDNREGFEGFIGTNIDIDPFGPLTFEHFFNHSTDAATGVTTVTAWAVSTNGTPINVAGGEARQSTTLSVLDDSVASFRLVDAPPDAVDLFGNTFGFRSATRVPLPATTSLMLSGLVVLFGLMQRGVLKRPLALQCL